MTANTTMAMASSITTRTILSSPSSCSSKSVFNSLPYSKVSQSQNPTFAHYKGSARPGLSVFSQWNGLRHLGVSVFSKSSNLEWKKKKCKGMVIRASLFGVGAPEALVIGVVALLVFGPKGLAEVARNLGKTLRAFQPTVRELQEVSREFKSTLEREIGLDDIPSSPQNMYNSNRVGTNTTPSTTTSPEDSQSVADANGIMSPNQAYSSEDYLKITEEQLKAAAAQQQEKTPNGEEESQPATQDEPQVIGKETATAASPPVKPDPEA